MDTDLTVFEIQENFQEQYFTHIIRLKRTFSVEVTSPIADTRNYYRLEKNYLMAVQLRSVDSSGAIPQWEFSFNTSDQHSYDGCACKLEEGTDFEIVFAVPEADYCGYFYLPATYALPQT